MARTRTFAAGVALLAGLASAACSNRDLTTSPVTSPTNTTAAAQFNRMGDSVIASGGSAGDAAPYYGAAGVIDQSPGVATIPVSIDGTAISMSAVAVAMEVFGGPMIACPVPPVGSGTAAPFVCPWGIPRVTRTLFAWTSAKPTIIVTLVASSDTGSIGTPIPMLIPGTAIPGGMGTTIGTLVDSGPGLLNALTRPIPAHLEYGDGTHSWWGTSGTQTNSVKPNGGACPAPPTATTAAARPGAIPPASCQLADFTFSFSGVVSAPPVAIRSNAGVTGTHTVSVNRASLTGVYFKLALPLPATHP